MSIDYNILYVIGICIAVLVVVFGIKYLKKNNIVDESDWQNAIALFKIANIFVEELNIQDKNQIIQISKAIIDGLERAVLFLNIINEADITTYAEQYVYTEMGNLGIEINENRMVIVETLINSVFNSKYGKELVK